MAEFSAEWCLKGSQEADMTSNELGQLTEDISKQNVLSAAWFLLVAYSKIGMAAVCM